MKDHVWKIVGVIAVVAIGASIVYSNSVSKEANMGVVFQPHIKGNLESTITVTEYSDFQCPACGQFYGVVKAVMEEYGDAIAFEYKHFPLSKVHPFALPAARAAEAAGQQGKFFEMHDKLFENQQVWSASPTPQAFFNTYAAEIGLDVALFKRHMKASVINDKISAELDEAQELGLTGTPSFFLNGERMKFQTYEGFVDLIEAAVNPSAEEATPATAETSAAPSVRFGF